MKAIVQDTSPSGPQHLSECEPRFPAVSALTFIGEFLLALWLVIWGRRITVSDSERTTKYPAAARHA